MKIVGYKVSAFDTKDGTHISGITFYVTYTVEGKNNFGLCTDKIFLSDQKLQGKKFDIGDRIIPVYNRFGKVQEVSFAK